MHSFSNGLCRFFPPKHIRDVGTFQDAGPLENDPIVSALSEVAVMFPLVEEPDFVISLGTGEPASSNDLSPDAPRSIWKNGAFPRLCRLFWEKMRDKKVRQAFHAHPRYHRLNFEFDGEEPRLDNTESMSELQSKVDEDPSLSTRIDNIARCVIASFFYFELDAAPRRCNGKFVGSGRILCVVKCGDPAYRELFDQLASIRAYLVVNDCPIVAVNDPSCFGKDGNFRKLIDLETADRFAIYLKQDAVEPYNISGSPFSVERLIAAQGLEASFGRSDHRKRKSSSVPDETRRKRRRLWT